MSGPDARPATDTPRPPASTERPSARLAVVAVAEVGVALTLAWLVAPRWGGMDAEMSHDADSTMAGMSHGEHSGVVYPAAWLWLLPAAAALTAIAWAATRRAATVTAVLCAVLLLIFAVSTSVREAAGSSHLMMMIQLEILVTAVPLAVVVALRGRTPASGGRVVPVGGSRRHVAAFVAGVVGVAVVGVVVMPHTSVGHRAIFGDGSTPWWFIVLVPVVAVGYWALVLGAVGRLAARFRLRLLLIPQEIAAVVGLVSIFGGPSTDHRIGGVVMIVVCGVVTVPAARALQVRRSESV